MIVVKEFPSMQFADKSEMFKHFRENATELIATKKLQTKEADAVVFVPPVTNNKGEVIKSEMLDSSQIREIKAELVINTTNLLDSHSDVHIKGIWNKSVKEIKNPYLLQEHAMKFDKIISDTVKASVNTVKWSDLGFTYKGTTEALTFDANITKDRNPFMFEQYAKGYVKEHSVGMRYVKLYLCMDSEDKYDAEYKENWDKYIGEVANKAQAEAEGYFFAVTEAKIVEGSAVVKGSNHATPTMNIEAVKDNTSNNEPLKDTQTLKQYRNTIFN